MGEAMNLRLASPFHLHGVGAAYTLKLALCGVETIGELVRCENLEELASLSTIPLCVLRNIQLKAKSIIDNEIIQTSPFRFPSEKHAFLDIETTLRDRMVWLIGLKIEDMFTKYYACDWNQERLILSRFLDILREYPHYHIVTWTRFDTRVLFDRMRLNRLDCAPLSSMAHIDLKQRMKQCFIFPTRGYGLKTLGAFLGYKFKNRGLNGLQVALMYQKHLSRGTPLDSKVFSYNEDDVKVLHYVVDWAATHVNHARNGDNTSASCRLARYDFA